VKPASVWKEGNNEFTIELKPAKKVSKITLGAPYIPDANRTNNSYSVLPEKAKNWK
jgi:hypothetical protein